MFCEAEQLIVYMDLWHGKRTINNAMEACDAGPLLPRIVLLLTAGVAGSILVTGQVLMLIRRQTMKSEDRDGQGLPLGTPALTRSAGSTGSAAILRRLSAECEVLSPRAGSGAASPSAHLPPGLVASAWGECAAAFPI